MTTVLVLAAIMDTIVVAGQQDSPSRPPFVGEHVHVDYRDGRDVQGTISSITAEGMLLLLATGTVEWVRYNDVGTVHDVDSGLIVTVPTPPVRHPRRAAIAAIVIGSSVALFIFFYSATGCFGYCHPN